MRVSHPKLLQKLQDLGVKATFFVVGENVNDDPTILHRMLNEGHMVGNHSMTHSNLLHVTDRALLSLKLSVCRSS
ncbi:polysaccharide deacetylase family protein [Verrucomicrobiota bacterium]